MAEILDALCCQVVGMVEGLFGFEETNALLHKKFKDSVEKLKLEHALVVFLDLLDFLNKISANFISK